MRFEMPDTLEDALASLAAAPARVLAGGTDVYAALDDRPPPPAMLALSRIGALRGIRREGAAWRIGATATWSEIASADLPPAFDALRTAARTVGGVQIQNAGTIAGNLCNASPAADGVPPLLALDSEVELASLRGTRRFPLADFLTGPRRTALAPDEIVTAILVPDPPGGACSAFLKLGARRYLVISIAMVAAVLTPGADGRIARAAVAVGACSPVARRLPALEAALAGVAPGPGTDRAAAEADLSALSPIDDVRAPAAYRLDAVRELVARALRAAGGAA